MTDTIASDRLDRALLARALSPSAHRSRSSWTGGPIAEMADRIRRGHADFPTPSDLGDLARRDVDRLNELDARLITRDDDEWPRPQPTRLNRTMQPGPFALYLRGTARLDTLIERAITVTGSRAATGYGRAVTDRIAAELTTLGWTVVAGSAYGVAAIAHKAALSRSRPSGRGSRGRDRRRSPARTFRATRHHRHQRTVGIRIPAGYVGDPGASPRPVSPVGRLSRAVLIIESTPGGEPATIAAHAVRHRVPVFAVPGPVTSATTALPHELIATGRARLITSGHDIHHFMS